MGQTVVHDAHEAVRAHGVADLGRELGASFGRAHLRKVDNGHGGVLDCSAFDDGEGLVVSLHARVMGAVGELGMLTVFFRLCGALVVSYWRDNLCRHRCGGGDG